MHDRAQQVLQNCFGYDSFRPYQKNLVQAVLEGQDVLGIMPTGAGKSLIYQVPALVLEGLSIIISPLISLMKDQVDSLLQRGVDAACLTSALSPFEQNNLIEQACEGRVRLLYVAPERLGDSRFLALCKRVEISLIAVDEAHCVSQWGKDFRPSYTRISTFIATLPKRPPICALTATATEEVRRDIVKSLDLDNPLVCVAGFDRANLYFGVERPLPAKKDACLLKLIREHRGKSGIVYCSTRNAVDTVCALLNEEGYHATKYHAGLEDAERKHNQEVFLRDDIPIIVATNAFGMGIDKSNVGFVIHYNMPRDIESYYQEAGRAGRDGSLADCILIYNKADTQTVGFFAERSREERIEQGMDIDVSHLLYQRDLDRIHKMTIYSTTTDCLRAFFLRYFGESDAPFRCENCSSCHAISETVDATTEALKMISCVLRLEQRNRTVGRTMIIDILRGSKSQKVLESGFDTLSTYGIMHDVPKDLMHSLLDALIADSLLEVTGGKYPVITCTFKGREFIKSKPSYAFKVAKTKLERNKAASEEGEVDGNLKNRHSFEGSANIDEDLFDKLRALRAIIAREQGIAAYIVFHDATLRDMCIQLPRTSAEFLEVSGVGQVKADRYATRFLECIAMHVDS